MKDKNAKITPLLWVPTVYMAMGLPFVMLNQASALMLRDMQITDAQIAFWTSLIILPWSLKPLWSPFMEMFRTKKFFVVTTQMITGVCFALIALSLPLPGFFPWAVALMAVIAFSGSTHDIATDGIYITELDLKAQARYAGWQGAFYNTGKLLAAGGLVYLAGMLKNTVSPAQAWMAIMAITAGLMLLLSLYHARMLPSGGEAASRINNFNDGLRAVGNVFTTFFQKRHIGWYLLFILFYRLAEGFAIKIVPLFLNSPVADGGLGLSTEDIGLIVGTFGTGAFILGSILAGHFVSARGLRRTLFTLCCCFNIPFLVYLLLSVFQPMSFWTIGSAVVFEYFGYGFGFVGLMIFIMQQVAPGAHRMAHYAFASSLANLGVSLPGMASGYLSDWIGYRNFFIFVAIATIPAFLASWFVPFNKEQSVEENDNTDSI
ncbi:MAG: MFS transporter [Rikenellaceae bacterium]|nr:MFS transporter [Rikenellaceae bacterium]